MNQKNNDKKSWVEKVSSDDHHRAWEDGKLGKNESHAKKVDDVDLLSKPLPTSIRLPRNLIEELKKLAAEEGLSYQTYLKMVLIKHVKNKVA